MFKKFISDSIIYAVPFFLAKTIGLLLLPIYTRHLGPANFGFIELTVAISSILLIILPLEISQAVSRFLPESEFSEQLSIIGTSIIFTIFSFSLFGIIFYVFRTEIFDLFSMPKNYVEFTSVVSIYFLSAALIYLIQIQLRFSDHLRMSVIANFCVVISNLVAVLLFTNIGRLGVYEYFISQIISNMFGFAVGFLFIQRSYRKIKLIIEMQVLLKLASYSLPLLISSVGILLFSTIDKILIGKYIGIVELGYYGAASRFSAIIGIFFYVISTVMTPIVYKQYTESDTKNMIATIFSIMMMLMAIILILLYFYSELIMTIVAGPSFLAGAQYIVYLTLSSIFFNSYIFFMGMDIKKNTSLLSKINLSSGLFNLIFAIAMMPIYGVWGIIFAGLFANLTRIIAYVYFSQKYYPLSLSNFAILKFWKSN